MIANCTTRQNEKKKKYCIHLTTGKEKNCLSQTHCTVLQLIFRIEVLCQMECRQAKPD
uniref:Uncharacterized protein n=1 Tax=Arundo donax TaxID=35708 RepID=A0A0A8YIZ3_ARUDO